MNENYVNCRPEVDSTAESVGYHRANVVLNHSLAFCCPWVARFQRRVRRATLLSSEREDGSHSPQRSECKDKWARTNGVIHHVPHWIVVSFIEFSGWKPSVMGCNHCSSGNQLIMKGGGGVVFKELFLRSRSLSVIQLIVESLNPRLAYMSCVAEVRRLFREDLLPNHRLIAWSARTVLYVMWMHDM